MKYSTKWKHSKHSYLKSIFEYCVCFAEHDGRKPTPIHSRVNLNKIWILFYDNMEFSNCLWHVEAGSGCIALWWASFRAHFNETLLLCCDLPYLLSDLKSAEVTFLISWLESTPITQPHQAHPKPAVGNLWLFWWRHMAPRQFWVEKKNLRPPPCNFLSRARLQQQ